MLDAKLICSCKMTTIPRMENIDLFSPTVLRGHGGKREGAGRKPADYVPPPEKLDFDKARARNEQSKADLNELEFKIKSKQYLPRAAIQQAAATAIASFAQTMRSVPDNLERTHGISPEIAEAVSKAIDNALEELAHEFQMMTSEPEVDA